ncbi:MAG: choice-of-anchor D domain-containing protein [Bacteroidota bacterium]
MKKTLQSILIGLAVSQSVNTALAQTITTGPSSSQSPFLLPIGPGYSITSILTHANTVGNYTMSGLADGTGAFDNNDGTFTMLVNHEMGNTAGSVRAHGQTGAFVSKWIINKSTLAVVSGADLIQNVNLWNTSTSTYSTYNAGNPSSLASFGRFCGAELAAPSAFYNSYTGKGTQERIYMNGEETGNEGRMFAHIATGPNTGTSYQLPFLGRFSCENQVANPRRSDKTIVAGFDDTTPGQVYIYVGNKSATGNEITKAGLTGGILYGVAVNGMLVESNGSFAPANTSFSLIALPNIQAITGTSLQTLSTNLGVSQFLRPEDGAWDPADPRDLYFVTTSAFNNPSRLWRMRFTDIENPQLGGTISPVLDGTEGYQMLDNVGFDNSGHLMLQEDPGGQTYLARIWEYNVNTDVLVPIAEHDPSRFITSATNFMTQDEESAGIVDVQSILGPGKFLFVDQAHFGIPVPVVEGGQILMLHSANTASSNPEINLQGNAVNIPAGNTGISLTDNTDFGTLNTGLMQTKTFSVQNTGTGPLWISSIDISGTNAGDFIILNPPVYPLIIAAGTSQTIAVRFTPALLGTRSATINLNNNDYSESLYDFAVRGVGAAPEINVQGNSATIPDGNPSPNVTNNTDFGTAFTNNAITKTFVIQNTGTGTLTVSGLVISGANASEFTMVTPPSFPLTLAGSASQNIIVQFLPTAVGTRTAMVNVNSDDTDESAYDFMIQGSGMMDVGIKAIDKNVSFVNLYPNPTKDEAVVSISLDKAQHVTVSIIDILGKVVSTSVEKDFAAGDNQMSLNTSDLKNGVYFVQVNAGDKTDKIKMIVRH